MMAHIINNELMISTTPSKTTKQDTVESLNIKEIKKIVRQNLLPWEFSTEMQRIQSKILSYLERFERKENE